VICSDGQEAMWEKNVCGVIVREVKCPRQIVSKQNAGRNCLSGGISRGIRFKFRFSLTELVARRLKIKKLNVWAKVCIAIQEYTSLHLVVMIRSSLVNTHTDTQLFTGFTISSASLDINSLLVSYSNRR